MVNMNKTITIYELLRLIKEGKAPKIVKWKGYIFSFYNNDYLCKNEDFIKNRETNYLLCYLFSLPESPLNIKVEIIEEDKKIEKLSRCTWQENGLTIQKMVDIDKVFDKVNELIDVVNELRKEVKE